MKIKGIGICPPPGAQNNFSVTPELLASCLARYSRSNKGIDSILASIDWNDPDKSVDSIFRFVDYGHASITGMTGGIAIVIDGCSMFLAYKLFEIAQLCDGQESSTRYIKMDRSNLQDASILGIPQELIPEWESIMEQAFTIYHELYDKLDKQIQDNPDLIRYPSGSGPKVVDRLRKNYALDRSRYFIPFATRTNAAFVMTARAWADTIKQLESIPLIEARECASGIRKELAKYVPRMIKHSYADEASITQTKFAFDNPVNQMKENGINIGNLKDEVFLQIEQQWPPFISKFQSIHDSFLGKSNRYSLTGNSIKRVFVRAAWNNMAIAELRDLNRHRSGYRFSTLYPEGFYLPEGVDHPDRSKLLNRQKAFLEKLLQTDSCYSFVYGLFLGTQVSFEHSTHLDKFIYEIELRTGSGAHFRYAEHLYAAYRKLIAEIPELESHINIGTAEPE